MVLLRVWGVTEGFSESQTPDIQYVPTPINVQYLSIDYAQRFM